MVLLKQQKESEFRSSDPMPHNNFLPLIPGDTERAFRNTLSQKTHYDGFPQQTSLGFVEAGLFLMNQRNMEVEIEYRCSCLDSLNAENSTMDVYNLDFV